MLDCCCDQLRSVVCCSCFGSGRADSSTGLNLNLAMNVKFEVTSEMDTGEISLNRTNCLRIKDFGNRVRRPNHYAITTLTSKDSKPRFIITCQVDTFADNALLHLFVWSLRFDDSFIFMASRDDSKVSIEPKKNLVKRAAFPQVLQTHSFENVTQNTCSYISTYHFTKDEIVALKDADLYIPYQMLEMNWSDTLQIKLKHDFSQLLNDKTLADFSIECDQGVIVNAHSFVLQFASEYFAGLLRGGFGDGGLSENISKKLKLHDLTENEVQMLLQWAYCGQCDACTWTEWARCLEIADRFGIVGLHMLAEKALLSSPSQETALHTLALANQHNAPRLANFMYHYIKSNPIAVLKSDSWKELDDIDIAKSIVELLMNYIKN